MSKTPQHHNIGNWHWDEKDFTEWSKKNITEKLAITSTLENETTLQIKVEEIKGEAFKIVRKNKLRQSFDFKIKMTFGYKVGEKDEIKGKITYEPFCDETDPEEWCFEVKIENVKLHAEDDVENCKKALDRKFFTEKLEKYIEELTEKMD